MWNNNDQDYDHVDAGNQERAELGNKVFNTLAVPLLLIATGAVTMTLLTWLNQTAVVILVLQPL